VEAVSVKFYTYFTLIVRQLELYSSASRNRRGNTVGGWTDFAGTERTAQFADPYPERRIEIVFDYAVRGSISELFSVVPVIPDRAVFSGIRTKGFERIRFLPHAVFVVIYCIVLTVKAILGIDGLEALPYRLDNLA
jgi:hypothetical protein